MTETTNLQVFLRIRPFLTDEESSSPWDTENTKVRHKKKSVNYTFKKVFTEKYSNLSVFDESAKNLIQKCLNGYNGSIFAYGQTASGKTHTMFGHKGREPGISYLSLHHLFNQIQEDKDNNYVVAVSFIEIYNELVSDLLSENEYLSVREIGGQFYVDGITERLVQDENEALELLNLGQKNKTMGYSYVHDQSSRSHTIFRLVIGAENKRSREMRVSELNFIDLAGAELLVNDNPYSDQAKETKCINLSLLSLKTVINALANGDSYIPYRNSVLTQLLQNSLGGNSCTALYCMISPSSKYEGMSKRTIKFGQVAKNVKTLLKSNILQKKVVYKKNAVKTRVDLKEKAESDIYYQPSIKEEQMELNSLFVKVKGYDKVHCITCGNETDPVVIVLTVHDFDASDWEYVIRPLASLRLFVVAPDYPGLGKSDGPRFRSTLDEMIRKGGPRDWIISLINALGVNKDNPCILVGYDWGATLALHVGLKVPNKVSGIIAFHPSWNADMVLLNQMKPRVLLLWVPSDQFHPFKKGKQMNKAIPKCSLTELSVGKYNRDKAAGLYEKIADHVMKAMSDWLLPAVARLKKVKAVTDNEGKFDKEQKNIDSNDKETSMDESNNGSDGNVINEEGNSGVSKEGTEGEEKSEIVVYRVGDSEDSTASIDNDPDINLVEFMKYRLSMLGTGFPVRKKTDQKVEYKFTVPVNPPETNQQRWAVQRFIELLLSGDIQEYYNAYLTSTPLKPKAVQLFSYLPVLSPTTQLHEMKEWGIWPALPKGVDRNMNEFPRYPVGRQVLVRTKVNGSIMSGDKGSDYLTFNPRGDTLVTPRAYVRYYYDKQNRFEVAVAMAGDRFENIQVNAQDVLNLNGQTNFLEENGQLIMEDKIKCKYNDLLTKAKILEAALSVRHLVARLDFDKLFSCLNDDTVVIESDKKAFEIQKIQMECVRNIWRCIDLIHCVHEGIHPKRSFKPEVGRLAYFGQGNCHALASVFSAFLLPFAGKIGIEVKFRTGSCFCYGRDLDPLTREPIDSWDGKPRNIDDHTWVEVTYIPTMQTFLVDPSPPMINQHIDLAYSRYGRLLPIDKRPCDSKDVVCPPLIFNDNVKVVNPKRLISDRSLELSHGGPEKIIWTQLLGCSLESANSKCQQETVDK